MSISKELFLALLSKDAYNRGYAPGVEGLGGPGSRLGPASVLKQSEIEPSSSGVSAGFYAIAYTVEPDSATMQARIGQRPRDRRAPEGGGSGDRP